MPPAAPASPPESDDYLSAVDAWQHAWRPQQVKALLVAESPIAESAGDAGVRVRRPSRARRELPDGYARVVHCIGYGEPTLCSPRPPANGGSWQVWNLLAQISLGAWARMPRGVAPDARLRWKLDVLEGLVARGIWLRYASRAGLQRIDGQRVADGPGYEPLIRDGYEQHVWPSVADAPPEQVWVIGRGVGKALAGLPGIDPERVISHPEDSNASRYLKGLRQLMTELAPGQPPDGAPGA